MTPPLPSRLEEPVCAAQPCLAPRMVKERLPLTELARAAVREGRRAVRAILDRSDDRLLVLVGPCSLHDRESALEYAGRLVHQQDRLGDRLCILMRAYFEKPRTVLGWKGLVNDPHLDGSCDLDAGYLAARRLLLDLAQLGLPVASEFVEPITPRYLADLVSWASVGARTAESQAHREMASGLPMPTGFKNSTDGNVQIPIRAVLAARTPHTFPGIDEDGRVSVCRTSGNPWGHLVLRGGSSGPNYDPVSLRHALRGLEAAGLPTLLVVDCSHGNSGYRHERQPEVLRSVLGQRLAGNRALVGVMIESHLEEGRQTLPRSPVRLRYGVSITDACVGWETTKEMLELAYQALG